MKPDTLNLYGALTFPRTKRVALIGALLGCAALIPARAGTPEAAAEFGGQCVEGLSQGRHITTKCAVTWADKDGKTYCFSSEDARKSFLENPGANLQKARDFIAASSADSTEKAMQNFDSGDAETLVKGLIEERAKASGGLFPLGDPTDGTQLKLAFDGIDFTRTIDGYGFFPDVKFHDPQDAQKRYLIDFWVAPSDGQLKVQEIRIYKEPIKAEGSWTLTARSPVPWWWIPASEHPGHMATKRGREVMSAVDPGAQSARAQERSVGSGAALRVEGPRALARGAVSRASRHAARSESSLRRGAAACRTGQRTAAATTPQGLPPTAIRVSTRPDCRSMTETSPEGPLAV